MQLLKGTVSAGVDGLIKKPLGNAAKNEAVAQLADVFGQLNGELNNKNMEPILEEIKKQLKNDALFDKFKNHIEIELLCFFYQRWNDVTRARVATAIAEVLKTKSDLVKTPIGYKWTSYVVNTAEDNMHDEGKMNTAFAISQAVKTALSNQSQRKALVVAIKEVNVQAVCACLAAGVDASDYIYLAIINPKSTKLLPYLLRAGVNPTDVYDVKGIAESFAEGGESIGKFVGTLVRVPAKLASENNKKNLNILTLAVKYNNLEAVKILLENDHAIYYRRQIEDALNYQVVIDGTSKGSALTIALMKRTTQAREIAKLLIMHGAKLSIVKGGAANRYPCYNNLQLIAKFEFEELLNQALALNIAKKPTSCLQDLLMALQYQTNKNPITNQSCFTVRKHIERSKMQFKAKLLDMLDFVVGELEKEIKRREQRPAESAKAVEMVDGHVQQQASEQHDGSSGGLLGFMSFFSSDTEAAPASGHNDNNAYVPRDPGAENQAAVATVVEAAPAPAADSVAILQSAEDEQPGWGERLGNFFTSKLTEAIGFDYDGYDDQESNNNASY